MQTLCGRCEMPEYHGIWRNMPEYRGICRNITTFPGIYRNIAIFSDISHATVYTWTPDNILYFIKKVMDLSHFNGK